MIRSALIAVMLVLLPAAAQEGRREYIYGGELMSPKERAQYRRDVSGAKDDAARARVRARHRERLQERARSRGVTLDEQGVVRKK